MHTQPQLADPLHHRLQRAANGGDLTGHDVRLLAAHPLSGRPAQTQQEGRDARPGHQLLQNLAHRHLAVQHLVVRTDDPDLHIAGSHKVPDGPVPGCLHGGRPLPCHRLAPLLGHAVLISLAHHSKAHISHSLPVLARSLENFQQNIHHKGHGPQHGHSVRSIRLRLEGCKQQKLLPGQLPHTAIHVPHAKSKVQRGTPLFDLQSAHIAAQQGGDIAAPLPGHDLAHRSAAGEHGVQIAVQEGLDAPLPPSGIHRFQETVHPLLRLLVPAHHRQTTTQADDFDDGRVHHGDRLPDGPVQGNFPIFQRHVAVQYTEGMAVTLPQLDPADRRLLFFLPQSHHTLRPLSQTLSTRLASAKILA